MDLIFFTGQLNVDPVRRIDSYNWCSRLDQQLSSFDYDNDAVGVNYYYRHYYPRCVASKFLNSTHMKQVESKNLTINQCGNECSGNIFAFMKVSLRSTI